MIIGAKKIGLIIFASMVPVAAMGMVFASNTNYINKTKASAFNIELNSTNKPTLTDGTGTIIDAKGVTWEYYNASDNANGHITLNDGGYFGISTSSNYGINQIESITATFTNQGNELWLLSSVDGVEWSEQEILTSGTASTKANDWKYVRFYNYSSNDTSISVESVAIGYGCSGEGTSEDVDSAHIEYLQSYSTSLTPYRETSDVSPLGGSTEAIRFERDPEIDEKKTTVVISLRKSFVLSDIANQNIEFDLKVANNYGKIVELMSGNNSVGLALDSNTCTSYEITPLGNNWYHIELPINAIDSLISGCDGKNVSKNANKVIDGIRFNVGASIIDNLRIGGTQCAAGVYNSKTYKPVVGEFWWFKVSWTGVFHNVEITLSDNTIGRRVPTTDPRLAHASPFYIEWLASGTVTLTATVTCGYNRTVQTVEKTITIS